METKHLNTFVKFFVGTLILTWAVMFLHDCYKSSYQSETIKTQSQIEFEELGLRGSIYE